MNRISLYSEYEPPAEISHSLFPATACQSRVWAEQVQTPDASAFNVAFRLNLAGGVKPDILERALNDLISRHEILRTGFVAMSDGLKQQVWAHVPFRLSVVDASGAGTDEAWGQVTRIGRAEAQTPFNLDARSFFRAVWVVLSPDEGELLLTFHALVMDGWSFAMLVQELVDRLSVLEAGQEPAISAPELHHGDYALWKQEFLNSPAIEPSRTYWRKALKDFQRFDVPTDRPRPNRRRHQGVIRSILLPKDLGTRLDSLSRSRGLTLFNLAAASLGAALARTTGRTDIAFGTQVSVRDQQELETVMGPLINTVVLRLDAARDPSLIDLATQCATYLGEALNHIHIPFEDMITLGGEISSPERPPLVSVNLALQQSFIGVGQEVRKAGILATTPPSYNTGALYDLGFFMVGRPEGWRISCEGDTDLFDAETIDSHLARWRDTLEALVTSPDKPLSAIFGLISSPAHIVPSPFLSPRQLEATTNRIVCYNPDASGTPVIALNNTAVFYDLSRHIGTDRPFIDIPMVPESGPQTYPSRAFEDIAADAVRLIRAARPKGPYILMGLCVLGALALEAARQLQQAGESVELVILNDSWCPGYRETMPVYDKVLRKLQIQAYNLPRDLMAALKGEITWTRYLKSYRLVRATGLVDLALKLGWLKGRSDEHTTNENRWYTDYLLAQQERYRPALYEGDVQIFRSAQVRKGRLFAHDLGWSQTISGCLTVTEVPALHDQMFRPAGAEIIGRQVREWLKVRTTQN